MGEEVSATCIIVPLVILGVGWFLMKLASPAQDASDSAVSRLPKKAQPAAKEQADSCGGCLLAGIGLAILFGILFAWSLSFQ